MNYSSKPNGIPRPPSKYKHCEQDRCNKISPHWKSRIYNWGSYAINANNVIGSQNDIKDFDLFFTSKFHNRYFQSLPWLLILYIVIFDFVPDSTIMTVYNYSIKTAHLYFT